MTAATSDYDEWVKAIGDLEVSIADVRIDGEVIYACAKTVDGRVVAIWNPDEIDAPFNLDALH